MAVCCWRFHDPSLSGEINLAVKGAKRARELADQLLGLTSGSRFVRHLDPLPAGPIRHVDGGEPLDGGPITAFGTLEIEVTPEPCPELTVEVREWRVCIGVPEIMLPEMAAIIADSHCLRLQSETWIHALVEDEADGLIEGEFRVWTWDDEGLLFGE